MSAVDHGDSPSRLRQGMPDPVPVVQLARLALDRDEQRRHLGGHLLVDALRRCVRGGREFGARAVVVDAIDERAADFYRHFDFHDLDSRRLWRRLSDGDWLFGNGEDFNPETASVIHLSHILAGHPDVNTRSDRSSRPHPDANSRRWRTLGRMFEYQVTGV
jgi:hypothetical protein